MWASVRIHEDASCPDPANVLWKFTVNDPQLPAAPSSSRDQEEALSSCLQPRTALAIVAVRR